MADRNDELTTARRRLPDLRLQPVGGGPAVSLRPRGRKAPILVLVHPGGCADCRAYLGRVAEHRAEIEEWDGRVIAVVPGPDSAEAAEFWNGTPFPVVADPDGRVADALSVEAPALAVADQWGDIHAAEAAGPEHHFLEPAELVEWARFLAIQCPECEGEAI